jgi:hypothetical protein
MRKINNVMVAVLMVIAAIPASAQKQSPKAETKANLGSANVTIVYSQPSARGRKIVGGLVPYGEVWRTGANEATTIEFDKNVKVEGKDLAAGKYAMYSIPENENEWTIIFNKEHKKWGTEYNAAADVLRVKAKATKSPDFVETFTISTEKDQVLLKWENTVVAFKVK